MSRLYTVFVYGTLKRGEPNHKVFEKSAKGHFKFLFDAETTVKYPLIIGTQYNIPFLLYKPNVGNFVKGEIYEVDDLVLKDLDELEDHPNFYIREEHDFKLLNGEKTKAWVYFIKNFKASLTNQEMYDNYTSLGSHGKKYVESEESTIEDLNGSELHRTEHADVIDDILDIKTV